MARRMLIDASHPEETRVVVVDGTKLTEFDFETASRRPLKGNIYLAKVIRIEPSLQAAFVEYGGNRHGFLAFSEVHPDYWQIPVADRERLIAEQQRLAAEADDEPEAAPTKVDRTDIEEVREENREAVLAEVTPAPAAPEEEPATPAEAVAAEPLPSEAPLPEPVAEAASSETVAEAQAAEVATDKIDGPAEETPAAAADPAEAPQPEAAPVVETLGGDDGGERETRERRRRQPVRQYKIQEVLKRRQILLVQVVKEERGNKGAALTTYLSLAGRYCVLMPNAGRGGGISRKISNPNDRKRMKEMLAELEVPQGMGVILRTAGLERSNLDIKRDYEYLSRLWDSIRELTMRSTAPALIYEEGDLIKRSLRDVYDTDIQQVLVEGEAGHQAASEFMRQLVPHQADKVELYKEPIPLFHRYQVESQFDAMHSPVVQLRSGGYIVINPTEALVAIDVNSGRATKERNIEETALRTNIEAAEEIARQVRLRDLAGLIVIDFIDMEENRHQRQVEHKVKDAMRHDRARIQIGRISAFGLLEMSRQRLRPSLLEHSTEVCPHCAGTGRIRSIESAALHALRAIEEEGVRHRASEIAVSVPPNVALYLLNQKRRTLSEIEQRYGFTVLVEADEEMHAADVDIERVRSRRDDRDRPAQELARASYEEVAGDSAGEEAAAEGDGPAGERAGDEDSDGQGRRRRRRRRRGRRDGEGREHDDRAPMGNEGAHGEAAGTNGAEPPAGQYASEETPPGFHGRDDGEEPLGDGERQSADDGERHDGDRPEGDRGRRRRGRRGGRRRRRENGEGDMRDHRGDHAGAEHGEHSHDQHAHSEHAADDHQPVSQPAPMEGLPVEHMPVERAPYEPRTEMPAEPPPPPAAPMMPPPEPVVAQAPQPVAAPEPPPPVVPATMADTPPEKPKRGWWRR
jgi:ribonuclease E